MWDEFAIVDFIRTCDGDRAWTGQMGMPVATDHIFCRHEKQSGDFEEQIRWEIACLAQVSYISERGGFYG